MLNTKINNFLTDEINKSSDFYIQTNYLIDKYDDNLNNLNIYYDQSFELFDYGQDLLNLNKNRFIEYRQIHYGKNEFCLNSYLNNLVMVHVNLLGLHTS